MDSCDVGNEYDGRMPLRISAIFVILLGSALGAWFPVFASRRSGWSLSPSVFFFFRYFGSGVILATAFIHLLAPASEALRNPCLTGPITAYSWVEAICLMSIFVLFFVELLTMRYTTGFTHPTNKSESEQASSSDPAVELSPNNDNDKTTPDSSSLAAQASSPHHHDALASSFPAQLAGVFILEFGVIFHSVFIGLTLAVSGAEFPTLYVVLVFHQTFEGLAIGSRLATIDWPRSKRRTPYFLGLAYALSTPIAIAAGLAVRASLEVGGASFLIINGVFDAISAGILIYTGLVELMAHDFIFNPKMHTAPVSRLAAAGGIMCLGAGLMALLGNWA